MPAKPVAYDYGFLSINYGLLLGIVAYCSGLLVPGPRQIACPRRPSSGLALNSPKLTSLGRSAPEHPADALGPIFVRQREPLGSRWGMRAGGCWVAAHEVNSSYHFIRDMY